MIRPHAFRVNPQTAVDNAFQRTDDTRSPGELARRAHAEVGTAAATLRAEGVRVHLFDDDGRHDTPDSVFPNNWFSTHADGRLALYPMASPNRRRERRADVIELLKAEYEVHEVVDYSGLEDEGVFLEGTGAMVLDHIARVAHVSRSQRADAAALARFCAQFGYEPMLFDAADAAGRPIYHTNVLMCVATEFALVGLELVRDAGQRGALEARLAASGREVIPLSAAQIGEFAGNAMELAAEGGRLLAMSARAAAALTAAQRRTIARSARIVALTVPTIELAGGSVRCMLAGVHLARR